MSEGSLEVGDTEDISRMLMALVQEVWIMRDRMAVTEQLLEEKLGITPATIDDYVGSPQYSDTVHRMRDQFAMRIVGAPVAARERSVEQILKRAGFGDTAAD
ncbi:MAG: hypothetical protein ACI87W_000920 [Halieaceae bacterium]